MPVGEHVITVTGTAQQAAWRDRVLPPVEQVRPGLWSIPTVFEGPLRYVLAYLVEGPGGPVLIDTGWPAEESWDGLVAGVRATGHDITDIKAILVTHFHADHLGLAGRVREASGAWIGMHELDARAIGRFGSLEKFVEADAVWLRRRGVPDDEAAEMMPLGVSPKQQLNWPDVMIEDGARPLGERSALRAIWTPGHTPGHLCFAHETHNVLLTGDHVLPRISPNISPAPGDDDDVLGQFLASLEALAAVEVDEVLPAHEYRFRGLPARVGQLQEHHRARLQEIRTVVGTLDGCTTAQVAERLTWSRPWEQNRGVVRRSAIGETYAHLVHLNRSGLVVNRSGDIDSWHLK